jgi:Tfp pilus assembly protein PilZ
MKQLEQITSKPSNYGRRKYIRKDCLISARISVANRILTCFILDISPQGAYIDSDEGIVVGQPIKLMFSSPNTRERLILSGEVVWSENQGAGIKFTRSNPKQIDIIRSFAENKRTIYEINSC